MHRKYILSTILILSLILNAVLLIMMTTDTKTPAATGTYAMSGTQATGSGDYICLVSDMTYDIYRQNEPIYESGTYQYDDDRDIITLTPTNETNVNKAEELLFIDKQLYRFMDGQIDIYEQISNVPTYLNTSAE